MADYREEQVTIDGKYALKGTMTIPEGTGEKHPAVLMIAGSGKVDRDGNAGKALKNAYTELIDRVGGMGFVTLRYDKRGVGESEGQYYQTGMWDLVDDVLSAVEFLKQQPSVDPENIILMGHSEGCMLAEAANAKRPVAGLILISGAAETLASATARQRRIAMDEMMNEKGLKGSLFRLLKVDKKAEKQNEKLTKKIMESGKDVMRVNLAKLNAKWMREHYSHDVIEDLKQARCPVLAVTGAKDVQADPERIQAVPELVQGEGTWRVIENMDHYLKEYTGPLTIVNLMKQYKAEAEAPVHPELMKTIGEWLAEHYLQ
mgnify:CR=1 FL=1